MCPFCYIGKRKFEAALAQFPNSSDVQIEWKSFQLAPDMVTSPGKSIHQFLADHKGMGLEQAKGLNNQVAQMAKASGLTYNFDTAVPANSFKAHQYGRLAKHHNVQDAAEEQLFKAYFTDGKNIDDTETLVQLGTTIGLNAAETRRMLDQQTYAAEVEEDINEAMQLGVRGVPFFVFDRKYAVSGAQDTSVFLDTIKKSFTEWAQNKPLQSVETIEGDVCTPGGDCN